MILLNRFIPIFCPFLIFASYELLLKKPFLIYWLFPILILTVAALIWKLIGKGLITIIARWNFLISPLFLMVGGLFFILFLENQLFKHFLIFLVAFLLGLYLEAIFIYIYRHEKYQINSLENISSYINLISLLFFYSGFFGLLIFLNISVWLVVLLVLLVTVSLAYQTMWINKIDFKKSFLYILIIGLILCQLAWVISFLPIDFYASGAFLSVVYYLLSGLSRFYLLGTLNSLVIKRHLIIGSIVLILILGTTRWI